MCGIAGLFLKNKKLEPDLGALLANMLAPLSDRGPDSAGFAIYGAETPGSIKFTLRSKGKDGLDGALKELREAFAKETFKTAQAGDHIVLSVSAKNADSVRAFLVGHPEVEIVGSGRRMEIYKHVGRPEVVSKFFGLPQMAGTHAIGHTRMATESAVTTNGAHPFSAGPDQCLVHNGSLSNHNAVRRELIQKNLSFQTENDTEVAAGYLTSKIMEGQSFEKALEASLGGLDGFYTFVVGTEAGMGVLRDPVACKPAVMAETDDWVAFGTEYRALVDLPGVETARVWEPEPSKVYLWESH
jgi:glutamate synthase domain-containing protein 1